MSDFTPGPWVPMGEDDNPEPWCVMTPDGSHFGPYIATVYEISDHAKANTCLIAAAPEMYGVLEEIASHLDDGYVEGCLERILGDKARAVLSKASASQ